MIKEQQYFIDSIIENYRDANLRYSQQVMLSDAQMMSLNRTMYGEFETNPTAFIRKYFNIREMPYCEMYRDANMKSTVWRFSSKPFSRVNIPQ